MTTMIATTTHFSNEIDSDLCQLVATLSLNSRIRAKESESLDPNQITLNDAQDVTMSSMECQMFPNSIFNTQSEVFGCPLLQTIQRDVNSFSTTAGGYLDTIFAHRAALARFPKGHVDCARGFGDLAFSLERRAWRTDREGDHEAVNAFRQESWVIANIAL